MRITNNYFTYTNIQSYNTNMTESYDILAQLNSTLKIQNSYQNTTIYNDSMRLEYELQTLTQVKNTAVGAQTFTNNSDQAFNQLIETLEGFKTKMIQAASSGSMSQTSRDAIANDLEGMKQTLLSIANTSINGNFLFSGSATTTKPFDQQGNYLGNNESLMALIGSNTELPFNITGQEIFLGSDNDYNKTVTTNIPMYNQTLQYPDIMGTTNATTSELVYLTPTDTIRDMVGDTDNITTNDPEAVFYVIGVDSYGDTFEKQINITSDAPISSLLNQIGMAYGNTANNTLVNVTMNDYGQIEIEDTRAGSTQLEFHMFAAIDRTAAAGTIGNASLSNIGSDQIDSLMRQTNVDIIEFTKSSAIIIPTTNIVGSNESISSPGTFNVGYQMTLPNGDPVSGSTLIQDAMGNGVTTITIDGTDALGNSTVVTLDVNSTTTFASLSGLISQSLSGATATIDNGQIVVNSTATKYGEVPIKVTLTANTTAFQAPNGMNKERIEMSVNGNIITGNVPQITSPGGQMATGATKLVATSGNTTLVDENLLLTLKDINGNDVRVDIRFDAVNPPDSKGVYFMINDEQEPYYVINAQGEPTAPNDVSYQQLFDIMGMALANTLPARPDPAEPTEPPPGAPAADWEQYLEDLAIYNETRAENYNLAINASRFSVEVNLNSSGEISAIDKTKAVTNMSISMYDANAGVFGATNSFNFMAVQALTVDSPKLDVFAQLDMMIEAVRNGQYSADASIDPDNPGVQNGITALDHILDHMTKMQTKIGSYSNTFNDAQIRVEALSLNITTTKTEIIGVDFGEAYIKLQQVTNSMQASLSAITQINQLSLLNYM